MNSNTPRETLYEGPIAQNAHYSRMLALAFILWLLGSSPQRC